jgi:hypothetical protein
MTNATNPRNNSAPKEIDTAALDQVVGAGVMIPDARVQEQTEKLRKEQHNKVSA